MNRDIEALLAKYLSPEEIESFHSRAKESRGSVWDLLLEERKIDEQELADAFSKALRVARVRLEEEFLDHTLDPLPEKLARRYVCLPLRMQGNKLLLCMANPADLNAIREVEFHTGSTVSPMVATRTEILTEIDRYYQARSPLADVVRNTWESQELEWFQDQEDNIDLDESESRRVAETGPVVRLVNLIITEALRQYASDIHVEPAENEVRVRNRVDGLLREMMTLPKWLHAGLVSRVKILANLDISERRRAQDGHIGVHYRQQRVDLRISTLPTRDGEKVVMRILGSGKGIPALETLGLESRDRELLLTALSAPQGLILVTGPTGSGKTTTLYSLLAVRKSPDLNIVTIEDPVEYDLPGVNQVQVHPKAGMTFAHTLRSILRQDPDVILLGEIRDRETAEIAFRAAMTGHMVLSSLHTNTALGTIYRLLDLGIEPFLVSSCLNLVMAQRLVRKVCPHCREEYTPDPKLLERLAWDDLTGKFVRGRGCEECGRTGYLGRIGLFEILPVTPDVQEAISQKATEAWLLKVGRAAGMNQLVEDAKRKIKRGETTVEEVLRVVHVRDAVPMPCPHCHALVQPNLPVCPYCAAALKQLCQSCGQEVKRDWKICPACSHVIGDGDDQPADSARWTQ
jgi:type II secretory ATPase GspE/PulE/Tfp pilus assembly ATPase PilB-like protein